MPRTNGSRFRPWISVVLALASTALTICALYIHAPYDQDVSRLLWSTAVVFPFSPLPLAVVFVLGVPLTLVFGQVVGSAITLSCLLVSNLVASWLQRLLAIKIWHTLATRHRRRP